jgi:small-conductance mechanosensitive channel
MAAPLTATELVQLAEGLLQPAALIEMAVLAACLLLAYGLLRQLKKQVLHAQSHQALGAEPADGIWFGPRVFDGVLFPAGALLLALLARWALRGLTPTLPLSVFKLVVPILLSLAVIRLMGRVLQRAFPHSQLMRIFERSLSWLIWAAVVMWITGLLPLILQELDSITWKFGATQVTVRNLLEGLVTAVLVLVLALWLSAALETRLLKGGADGRVDNLSIRKMAANAIRAVLLFIGLIFALEAAGIDLTALGVLGGALGVGIGFGLQKLAANYISGFVILAERSMRIGDLVKVDNFEGRITDISTRYTVIRALNGREAIVPNEMMITQRVENSSLADPKVLMSGTVQVAYGTNLDRLMPVLTAAVAAVPRVVADPPPGVLLSAFAADGLELTVAYWIADPQNGQGNVRSDVNLAVLRTLNAAGVQIPYPQRVVHMPVV